MTVALPTVLALPNLFNAVSERFEEEGTDAINLFGFRETKTRTVTGNRIAWFPGDPAGAMGKLMPARGPGGRNPRPLATLGELFTVEIAAADVARPEDSAAQYETTRLLFDAWYRAAYLAALTTFAVVSTKWIVGKLSERRYGCAVQVVCTIDAVIPDDVRTTTSARVEVDVHTLDETNTQRIAKDDT